MKKDLVCIAVVTGAHGVHGSVKVKLFTENPETVAQFEKLLKEDGSELELKTFKLHKNDIAIASFEGVKNRNQAEEMKSTKLFVPRTALPALEDEEDFYYTDLVGLSAHLTNGKKIGSIQSVQNHGAGEFLVISLKGGAGTVCAPFTKEAVPTVNIPEGFVIIEPLKSFVKDDLEKIGFQS